MYFVHIYCFDNFANITSCNFIRGNTVSFGVSSNGGNALSLANGVPCLLKNSLNKSDFSLKSFIKLLLHSTKNEVF